MFFEFSEWYSAKGLPALPPSDLYAEVTSIFDFTPRACSSVQVPPQLLVMMEELMQNACARREKLLQSTCSKLLDLLRESHTPHRSSAQGVTPKAKRKKHN